MGESHVSHNVTTGSEMGFQLYYESTGSNGLTDGDFFGVVDYTGTVGSFIDGDKGYEMSDVDGIATLEFDAVDADSVEFDLYVQQKLQSGQHANWETADKIVIWFDGANSEIEILNTTGDDIDTAHTSLLGTWTKYVVDLTGAGAGSLNSCSSPMPRLKQSMLTTLRSQEARSWWKIMMMIMTAGLTLTRRTVGLTL